MLIDYAFVVFPTYREMSRAVDLLKNANFKEFIPGDKGLSGSEGLRRRISQSEKKDNFDFAVWEVKEKEVTVSYQIEILSHCLENSGILELVKKIGNADIQRGFELASVPGLAELDLKAWIGETVKTQKGYNSGDEVVTRIEMNADGKILYYFKYWQFDDCDSHMGCPGHWHDYGDCEENVSFDINSIRLRKTPNSMPIKRDDSGKIIALCIY